MSSSGGRGQRVRQHVRAAARDPLAALVVACVVVAVVGPTALAAARGPARAGAPRGRAVAQSAGTERVVVELGRLSGAQAQVLSLALGGWEEAINAGSTRLTIDRAAAEGAVAAGLPVRITAAAPAALAAWPACVTRLDALYAWLSATAEAHPDLVTRIDVGDSFCKTQGGCLTPGGDRLPGDDLIVARVTAGRSSAPKTGRLWIDGGLHARELPTTELMRRSIERWVTGYGHDPATTWLLDHREVYVGLAMNPDGRRLVELGASAPYGTQPWYWRKNGRLTGDLGACAWPPTVDVHGGVDLNRNHDFKWTAAGASNEPCQQTYRGRRPASEPETIAYESAVRALMPDQRGPSDGDLAPDDTTGLLINFHNFTASGTVLAPWGWTTDRPPNDAGLSAIAARYAARVDYAWQYALYPVSGNTRDWAYGALGIPAYVIELKGTDFFPRCDEIDAILDPHAAALDAALALSDRPYGRIRAPETVALTARVERDADGHPTLRLDARFDVAGTPALRVAGGEATFGRAGGPGVDWPAPLPPTTVLPGQGAALTAADGAFDDASETAVLTVDISRLPPGPHYAVVSAQGVDGAWGPGRAVGFDVPGAPTQTTTSEASPSATVSATPSASPSATGTAATTSTPTVTAAAASTAASTATGLPSATPTPSPAASGTAAGDGARARVWLPIARRQPLRP